MGFGETRDRDLGNGPGSSRRGTTPRTSELPGDANGAAHQGITPRNNEYLALQSGEGLFLQGDRREAFYRVESGALVVLAQDKSGNALSFSILEAGQYLGFGFRSEYITSAYAIGEATVGQFDNDELPVHIDRDPTLAAIHTAAIRQEFALFREQQIGAGEELTPLQRVARVLLALSETAKRQGCNLHAVSDLLDSDYISDLVGISVLELTQHVRVLIDLGYLETSGANGIEISDVDGLHAMSR